jgi:hypothetical protein
VPGTDGREQTLENTKRTGRIKLFHLRGLESDALILNVYAGEDRIQLNFQRGATERKGARLIDSVVG